MKKLEFKEFNLENYPGRHINPISIKGCKKINLITGKNGAGKSTLCKAMKGIIWRTKPTKDPEPICGKLHGKAELDGQAVEFDTNENPVWDNDCIKENIDGFYDLDLGNLLNGDDKEFNNVLSKAGSGDINTDTKGKSPVKDKSVSDEISRINELNIKIAESRNTYEETIKKQKKIENNTKEIDRLTEEKNIAYNLKKIRQIEEKNTEKVNLEEQLKKYSPVLGKIDSNFIGQYNSAKDSIQNANTNLNSLEPVFYNGIEFKENTDYESVKNKLNDFSYNYREKQRHITENENRRESVTELSDLDLDDLHRKFEEKGNLCNNVQSLKLKINEIQNHLNDEKFSDVQALADTEIPDSSAVVENLKSAYKKEALKDVLLSKNKSLFGFATAMALVFAAGDVFFFLNRQSSVLEFVLGFIPCIFCVGVLYIPVFKITKEEKALPYSKKPKDIWANDSLNQFKQLKNELDAKKSELTVSENRLNEVSAEIKEMLLKYGFSEYATYQNCMREKEKYDNDANIQSTIEKDKKDLAEIYSNYCEFINGYAEYADLDKSNPVCFAEKFEKDLSSFYAYTEYSRKKNYYTEKIRETENARNELLKGIGIDTYFEYEKIIADKSEYDDLKNRYDICVNTLEQMTEKFPKYTFTEEEKEKYISSTEDYDGKITSLKAENEILKKNIEELKNMSTDTFKESREKEYHKLGEKFNKSLNAITEHTMKNMLKDKMKEFSYKINDITRDYFNKFAAGKYVFEKDKEKYKVIDLATNTERKLNELSGGTKSQLILAMKLAVLDNQNKDIKYPLFLDESFASCDEDSTKAIIKALESIKDRQIFYFSPKEYAKDEWENNLTDIKDFQCFDLS